MEYEPSDGRAREGQLAALTRARRRLSPAPIAQSATRQHAAPLRGLTGCVTCFFHKSKKLGIPSPRLSLTNACWPPTEFAYSKGGAIGTPRRRGGGALAGWPTFGRRAKRLPPGTTRLQRGVRRR